jgi:phospholipid transport system transporter-binding protein
LSFSLPAQLKLPQAASTAAAVVAAVKQGEREIDCAALQSFDSSALSVLLAAKRLVIDQSVAQTAGESLRILNSPAKLHQLALLYGVDSLLFTAAT